MTRIAAITPKSKASSTTVEAPPKKKESTRDFVEQVVVAFILAFLIRGFEAEAFVIPTGSMAPTLYGQHKEVTCPQCGDVFAVNAADEVDPGRFVFDPRDPDGPRKPPLIAAATCPNCWYRVTKLDEFPSFKGDRILVMKFLYNLPRWLGGKLPARWDVVVFHFPEEPETNYIKRLIGLPGETVRIAFGNIWTRPRGSDKPFAIARKPLPQQQVVQQLVWDDDHRPKAFADRPEWKRWTGAKWSEEAPSVFRNASPDWATLDYKHLLPDAPQWEAALTGKKVPGSPKPVLITDMYGYNSGRTIFERIDDMIWFKPEWVGDLTVSARVKASAGKAGKLRLDLVEAGVVNRCVIDLQTGDAILSRDGKPIGNVAATSLRDDGKVHDIAFANVDDRLTLWVDGKTPFGEGIGYETDSETFTPPTAADLTPVSIAAKGGEVEVSGLVLKRDLYYTGDPSRSEGGSLLSLKAEDESRFFDGMSNAALFPGISPSKPAEYIIQDGRYFMMGDNSPRSSDSRAWSHRDVNGYQDHARETFVSGWSSPEERSRWEVPESLIIGKAFFIYWPHGVPLWPNLPITRDFRFPFRPYVERMKWIR